MTAYTFEWLSLLGRWLHVIAGIAWIGSSFFFIWLNNHLLKPVDPQQLRRGVYGEAWMVHGGSFYHAQKYSVAPPSLPESLHWFYWEAYATFLSGLFLLCLMYYGQAEIYLIDPRIMALSKPAAIAIAIGFLAGGWLVYEAICRSPLSRHASLAGAAVVLLLAAQAWGLCHVFSGRGAFIQFGAMLGSIMVANVVFVIIPGQRKLVNALIEGREPNPEDGRRGSLRSLHNTYFTLPVLFTMTSNHYAVVYGARFNWLVLMAISVAGALIRVYFVARHSAHERAGRTSPVPLFIAAFLLSTVAGALAPVQPRKINTAVRASENEFAVAQRIVTQRCVPCHAAIPTQPGFVAPPKGITLETPEQILLHLTAMQQQLTTRAMPVGNLTGMSEDERAQLLDWMQDGAPH